MSGKTPDRWLVLAARYPSGPPGEESEGLLAEGLLTFGGRAVWEDGGALVTHLPEPDDPDAFLARATRELRAATGAGDLEVDTRWQAQEDWAEVWKWGLAPRRVTERLVVTPSWCDPGARAGEQVIVVDPGMAFGSAEHGTTRGCLRLLDGRVGHGERLLDVGAGSGILSVAAVRLGAAEVVAVEGDPWAVEPARENAERNGVADRVEVRQAWATAGTLADLGPRDGVIANIESGILRGLLPGLVAALRPGGWLLLSGLLDHEWPAFRAEVETHGVRSVAEDADGEWRSGLFIRGSGDAGR